MKSSGIVKHEDSGNYLISFTPPQFQDFISSLTSSSREERYSIQIGFDISKSNLRTFLDRINHQIETQNNVLSKEYTFTFDISDGRVITTHGYPSFFNIDDTSSEVADRLQVDATYMIGFNRSGEQKIERQVISLEFVTAPQGMINIRIMSTEITWPPTIFQLIEREARSLDGSLGSNLSSEWAPFRWIIAGLIRKRGGPKNSKSNGENSRRIGRNVVDSALLVALFTQLSLLLITLTDKDLTPIYNEELGAFERGNFGEYANNLGLDAAVALAQKSKILYDVDYAPMAPGHGVLDSAIRSAANVIPIWGFVGGVLVAAIFLHCKRRARKYEIESIGRIFVGNTITRAREEVAIYTGVPEAIIYGIVAALVLAAWQSLTRLMTF